MAEEIEVQFQQFSSFLMLQGLQEVTIKSYIKNVDYIQREEALESKQDLIDWFAHKKAVVSDNRYNKLVSSLRRFAKWAVAETYQPRWLESVAYNQLKPVPRSKIKTVLDLFAYTLQQEKDLLDVCSGWTERAIFFTGLKVGVRSRTIFGFDLDDVEKSDGIYGFHVRPEIDKNHLYRFVPVNGKENVTFLDNYIKYRRIMDTDSNKFIHFVDSNSKPTEFKGGTRSRIYERLTKALGARVALHNCRYTFAWKVWQATGDIHLVQYLLGHKNVQQTIEYLKVQQHVMKAHVIKKMRNVVI